MATINAAATIKLTESGPASAQPGKWWLRIGGGKFGAASVQFTGRPPKSAVLLAIKGRPQVGDTPMVPSLVEQIESRLVGLEAQVVSCKAALVEAREVVSDADKVADKLLSGERTERNGRITISV